MRNRVELRVLCDGLLMFSEACKEKLLCIKEGLEAFCKCSGQRINFQTSSMLFSSNVSDAEAERLSNVVGIPLTKKVDKYLGHLISMDGKNREQHKELLQMVQNRIEAWKLRCLSRAGSLTLAQSMLGSLPIFNMQAERLTTWMHRELDKA